MAHSQSHLWHTFFISATSCCCVSRSSREFRALPPYDSSSRMNHIPRRSRTCSDCIRCQSDTMNAGRSTQGRSRKKISFPFRCSSCLSSYEKPECRLPVSVFHCPKNDGVSRVAPVQREVEFPPPLENVKSDFLLLCLHSSLRGWIFFSWRGPTLILSYKA